MSDLVNDLVRDMIAKAADAMPEPRWSRQEKLQEQLASFNPDYLEAEELLDALFLNFKFRVSDGEWDRVEEALNDFKSRLYKVSQMHPEPPEFDREDAE